MTQFADREDFERYIYFESQRDQAEKDHSKNKNDPLALLRWGGALIELAHFQQGQKSLDQLDEAVSKLKAAVKLNDRLHEAHWSLGNAYTSQGLLQSAQHKADEFFTLARKTFAKALELDPNNKAYARAMEMIGKAPEIYQELQAQLQGPAMMAGPSGASSSSPGKTASSSAKRRLTVSEGWYDFGGWLVLAGIVTYLLIAQSRALPAAPPS